MSPRSSFVILKSALLLQIFKHRVYHVLKLISNWKVQMKFSYVPELTRDPEKRTSRWRQHCSVKSRPFPDPSNVAHHQVHCCLLLTSDFVSHRDPEDVSSKRDNDDSVGHVRQCVSFLILIRRDDSRQIVSTLLHDSVHDHFWQSHIVSHDFLQ